MITASTFVLAFLAIPIAPRPEPPQERKRTVTWQPFALLGALVVALIIVSLIPTTE